MGRTTDTPTIRCGDGFCSRVVMERHHVYYSADSSVRAEVVPAKKK